MDHQSQKIKQRTLLLETQTLNEYNQLLQTIQKMSESVNDLSMLPSELLSNFLPLERQLGLVLTLFKASVWSVLVSKEREDHHQQS